MTKDEYINELKRAIKEQFTSDNEYSVMFNAGKADEMSKVLQWHFGLSQETVNNICETEVKKYSKKFQFRKE